jgi:hypothetical protein
MNIIDNLTSNSQRLLHRISDLEAQNRRLKGEFCILFFKYFIL